MQQCSAEQCLSRVILLDRQGKKDRGEYQNDCVCATVKQCVSRERHNAQLSFRKSTSSPNPGLAKKKSPVVSSSLTAGGADTVLYSWAVQAPN